MQHILLSSVTTSLGRALHPRRVRLSKIAVGELFVVDGVLYMRRATTIDSVMLSSGICVCHDKRKLVWQVYHRPLIWTTDKEGVLE